MRRLLVFVGLAFWTLAAAAQQNTVDPRSRTDLVTQVNALATACGFHCTVRIPAGEYTVASGTILIHHAGLSLQGEGRNNTIIHYAGLNFLDLRLDGAEYDASYPGAGKVGGFTVFCSNNRVKCITAGSVIGQRFEDLSLVGPGGPVGSAGKGNDAEGFVLQNTHNWMERAVFRDISLGGFTTNFHFMKPTGSGTDSFAYALFDGIWMNFAGGSKAFVVDDGAALYHVLGFTAQFNSGQTTEADEMFSIAGAFGGMGFNVTGENSGAKMTFAHIACSGVMNFSGDYDIFFGEVVTDCNQGRAHQGEPFRVTPTAGLAGIRGSLGGRAQVPGYTALGQQAAQTMQLWPYDSFNLVNPNAIAYTGFIGNQTGKVSPISVFDFDVPWCVAARQIYREPDEIHPKLCLDGRGNLAAEGTLRGTSVVTTRPTPANSHEACSAGESWDDDDFHYHCTSKGVLKRMPLGSF